jgi:hypothetical protein
MLGNWLESIGLKGAAEKAKSLSPMVNLYPVATQFSVKVMLERCGARPAGID